MIATRVSLDLGAANRAEDDAIGTSAPALVPRFHGILATRAVPVPILTASEAYGVVTLRAIKLLRTHRSGFHVAIAVRLGAETDERVTFKKAFFAEIVQLVKHLSLLAREYLLELRNSDFLAAFVAEADDLAESVATNVLREAVLATFHTEAMFAIKLNGDIIRDLLFLVHLDLIRVADGAIVDWNGSFIRFAANLAELHL